MTRSTSQTLMAAIIIAAVCVSAAAQAPARGTLNGQVKDSAGKPQMGVLVEVFNASSRNPVSVFTDAKGFYSAAGLLPGTYFIKATAASFLPSLRENVELKNGTN